jgi:hypothetical protein
MPTEQMSISGAVEGMTDEMVLRSLIATVGAEPGTIVDMRGKDRLKKHLNAYNQASHYSPWCILLDLDRDADCAPSLCTHLLPERGTWMCFRVVVRSIEAWLMADRAHLAQFLSVAMARIPADVESIDQPKEVMVNLARHSRRPAIQQDMVPRPGSGRSVGPAYTARLIEFVTNQEQGWRPQVAANSADSLRRCLQCLQHMLETFQKSLA